MFISKSLNISKCKQVYAHLAFCTTTGALLEISNEVVFLGENIKCRLFKLSFFSNMICGETVGWFFSNGKSPLFFNIIVFFFETALFSSIEWSIFLAAIISAVADLLAFTRSAVLEWLSAIGSMTIRALLESSTIVTSGVSVHVGIFSTLSATDFSLPTSLTIDTSSSFISSAFCKENALKE